MSEVRHKIYLSAHGVKLVAGPAIVAAFYFPNPIPPRKKLKDRYEIELVEEYLSDLEEDKDYFCIYERIETRKLERIGYRLAVSRVANKLGNVMRSRMGLKIDSFVISDPNEVWGSLYDTYEVAKPGDPQAYFADCTAKYFSMWWMRNFYHRLQPNYDWPNNYGYGSYTHLTRILEVGPDWDFHRSAPLRYIARHWLHMLRRNDFWAMCQPFALEDPVWWRRKFRCNFLHFLSNNEVTEIYKYFYRNGYEDGFFYWLKREAQALDFPPELIELCLIQRHAIKEDKSCERDQKMRIEQEKQKEQERRRRLVFRR